MRIRFMIALWTCLALTLSNIADDIFAQSITNSTTLPARGMVITNRVNLSREQMKFGSAHNMLRSLHLSQTPSQPYLLLYLLLYPLPLARPLLIQAL